MHLRSFIYHYGFPISPLPFLSQITLVTRELDTPYSGMLPGHVAGFYTRDECHIDLVRLARFAKVTVVHCAASGIDPINKLVLFGDSRPPLRYDALSIDIGSTPNLQDIGTSDGSAPITPVKPIDGFSAAWTRILERVVPSTKEEHIVVVGGGAGGVELVLSMQARIQREREQVASGGEGARGGKDSSVRAQQAPVTFTLVSRTDPILPNHNHNTQRALAHILQRRGVTVLLGHVATSVADNRLHFADGSSIPVTECVWCTQASAAPWLRDTGLALDKDGFIAVHPTLQSTNYPQVFAAGDVAAVLEHPRPKAGVFAVRQGPPLTANLRAYLSGEALTPFEPQSVFLGLITTGDASACVASRGLLGMEGDWLFALKDWIDRKWMAG